MQTVKRNALDKLRTDFENGTHVEAVDVYKLFLPHKEMHEGHCIEGEVWSWSFSVNKKGNQVDGLEHFIELR